MGKNPYTILHVSPTANLDEIETAYRHLAKQYHPDLNKSPDATVRMQEINWAFALLKDPDRRWQYFRDHGTGPHPSAPARPTRTSSYTNTTGPAPYASAPFSSSPSSEASKQVWRRKWREEQPLPTTFYYFFPQFVGFLLMIVFFISSALFPIVMIPIRSMLNSGEWGGSEKVFSPCYSWQDITRQDLGREVCVNGKVRQISHKSDGSTVLQFADSRANYPMIGIYDGKLSSSKINRLKKGECLSIEGVVEKNPSGVGLAIHAVQDEDVRVDACLELIPRR